MTRNNWMILGLRSSTSYRPAKYIEKGSRLRNCHSLITLDSTPIKNQVCYHQPLGEIDLEKKLLIFLCHYKLGANCESLEVLTTLALQVKHLYHRSKARDQNPLPDPTNGFSLNHQYRKYFYFENRISENFSNNGTRSRKIKIIPKILFPSCIKSFGFGVRKS